MISFLGHIEPAMYRLFKFCLAVLFLLSCIGLNAQDRHFQIDAGIDIVDTYSHLSTQQAEIALDSDNSVVLPTFTVSAGYIKNTWHSGLFLTAYYNYSYSNLYGGPSPMKERETILNLVPEIRYYYIDKPRLRVYLTAGYGVRYRHWSETFRGETLGYDDFKGTFTLSPFGISWGEKICFSIDYSFGITYMPFVLRVGLRF